VNGGAAATRRPGDDRPRGVRFGAWRAAAGGEQGSGGQEHATRRPVSQRDETSRTPWLESGATSREGRGGANRRGGEKPRGRNTVGRGRPVPDATVRQRTAAAELTPRSEHGGGALFDNPKRGRSAGNAERHGSERVGKAGAKIRRVERSTSFLVRPDPPVGPRRPVMDAAKAEMSHKVMEGGGQANGPQRQVGISPVRIHSGPRASVAKRTNAAAMPGPEAHGGYLLLRGTGTGGM
jgi:hypothetical protein